MDGYLTEVSNVTGDSNMYPELKEKILAEVSKSHSLEGKVKTAKSVCYRQAIDTFYPNLKQVTVNIYDVVDKKYSKAAGLAVCATREIRLNRIMLEKHFEDMILDTIPHELSHFIVHDHYPNYKQAHGKEFRQVMNSVFGIANASTYHNYMTPETILELSSNHVPYTCSCGTNFAITNRIHQSILRGEHRICTKCKSRIVQVSIADML